MFTQCTQEKLSAALQITERFSGKNTTLPILENIFVTAEKGFFTLAATNLEVGVIIKITAKTEKNGKGIVPARILSSFVYNLPQDGVVSLEKKEKTMTVQGGGYQATIKTANDEDFPIIPQHTAKPVLFLPAQKLREALARISNCAASNETRPELSGVNFVFSEKAISFAATDSFRLAETTINLSKKNRDADAYKKLLSQTRSLIVPTRIITELVRAIPQEQDFVDVVIEEQQIFFIVGEVKMVSRLIDGKYPDYKQIIPKKFETVVIVPQKEFVRATKSAAIFTQAKGGEVILSVAKKGTLEITSGRHEAGGQVARLVAHSIGGAQNITLNPRFILEGVTTMEEPLVRIMMNSSTSPVVFCGAQTEDAEKMLPHTENLYIIMPIKNQ